jgi:hypothetical protein
MLKWDINKPGGINMPLQYSCFISYRHSQQDIVLDLAKSLQTELSRWLDMEVYLDREKLEGGDFFSAELAKALCESVCLIAVYTPTYFSKQNTFCAREFKAMEQLEEQRLTKLGLPRNKKHGLIIPVVYRGDKKLPSSIKSSRQYHMFESFQISGRDNLDNPEYAQKIKEIAEYIEERCEELRVVENDICECCDTFDFPSETEISGWLESMLPPKPLLPGREGV